MAILEKLGVYGLGEEEDFILAGLVTGDPVLLVGKHGSAKTLVVRKLSEALGLNFIAYDASKALFDDVIGFPNPRLLGEGQLDYIPTPLSIWDKEFVMIDEISRANPSMQNKWLEVIRSRRVMGRKIPRLKYVFAAMNPPSDYIGAAPLDPALTGRFSFIIAVPEVHKMSRSEIDSIIDNITEDDAAALKKDGTAAAVNDEVGRAVSAAAGLFSKTAADRGPFVTDYVARLALYLAPRKIRLDGRRLGMLRRNIIAYMSVLAARGEGGGGDKELYRRFFECIKRSIPDEKSGEPLEDTLLQPFCAMTANGKSRGASERIKASIIIEEKPLKAAKLWTEGFRRLSPEDHREIIVDFAERLKKARKAAELYENYLAFRKLIPLYISSDETVPLSAARMFLEHFRALYMDASSLVFMNEDSLWRTPPWCPDLSEPSSETVTRLTMYHSCKRPAPTWSTGSNYNQEMHKEISAIIEMEAENEMQSA